MLLLHHVGADETIKERERNKQKKKERCLASKKIKSWRLANPLAKEKKKLWMKIILDKETFFFYMKCIET